MSQQTIANTDRPNDVPQIESEPVVVKTYWIRCEGYRTRATFTSTGKWLLPYNGKEVVVVIGFF